MVWLILIAIAVVGYFLWAIYKHDDQPFSKQMGYSYFDVLFNKEAKAAYKMYRSLMKDNGTEQLLFNVEVYDGKVKHVADAVFIHESGIFVIDVLHKDGWIAGREFDAEWLNLLHKDKTVTFDNPINDNKRAVLALRDLLPEVNQDLFASVVLFTDGCSFQKIEVESVNVEVLKVKELKQWRASLAGELLSKAQIDAVYNALKPNALKKQVAQQKEMTTA